MSQPPADRDALLATIESAKRAATRADEAGDPGGVGAALHEVAASYRELAELEQGEAQTRSRELAKRYARLANERAKQPAPKAKPKAKAEPAGSEAPRRERLAKAASPEVNKLLFNSISEYRQKGEAAARKDDRAEASRCYHTVGDLYQQLADGATTTDDKRRHLASAQRWHTRANQVGAGLPETEAVGAGGDAAPQQSREDKDAERANQAVLDMLVRSPIRWEQIGGLDETKSEIKLALALSIARRPPGVRLDGWRNMLFYGPPGTGKTLLAAATSNALNRNEAERSCFFSVKVSGVLSKYFGESSKIVSALYTSARDMSPSVVFLDEFESLTASRDSGSESGAERRILSTILAELDGLAGKGNDQFVMTIAATNRPWDIDAAILSRFEKKVLIPLPDAASRRRILEILLDDKGLEVEVDRLWLVDLTDGYSGRELERLAKEVTGRMLAEANVDLVDVFDNTPDAAHHYQLKVRPLVAADFERAAAGIVPQTRPEDMARYLRWSRELE